MTLLLHRVPELSARTPLVRGASVTSSFPGSPLPPLFICCSSLVIYVLVFAHSS